MSPITGGNAMYLVSYDISTDKIRNKVAKKLLDYGKRVQYSVFECDIPELRYKKMYRELAKLMEKEEEGNIRIYYLCGKCETRVHTIGTPKETLSDDTLEQDNLIII